MGWASRCDKFSRGKDNRVLCLLEVEIDSLFFHAVEELPAAAAGVLMGAETGIGPTERRIFELTQILAAWPANREFMMYQAAGRVQSTIKRTPDELAKKAATSRQAAPARTTVRPQNIMLLSRAFFWADLSRARAFNRAFSSFSAVFETR